MEDGAIDLGSSSDEDDAIPKVVKVEHGSSGPTKSWPWDYEAERAVREVEEAYERRNWKSTTSPKPAESEPMVAGNPLDTSQCGIKLREGQTFRRKEDVQELVAWAGLTRCFTTKVKKSTTILYVVGCAAPKCKWSFRASTYKGTGLWKIRKLVDEHTCSLNEAVRQKRSATYTQLGRRIVERYVTQYVKLNWTLA